MFERSTTGVVVTPLAVRILPHLHALLANLDALLAEARAATGQDTEPLRMGVSPLIHPELVARAFQAARQHAPAALILKEDNLADLQTALLARQLDVILVPSVIDATGCQRRSIDAEPLHYLPGTDQAAVAPKPAMLATSADTTGQPIELTELSAQPLVMVNEACGLTTFTRTLFATTGAQLRSYPGEADSYRSLEDWANLGLGGALMPASRFRGDKPTRPVYDHGQPITISYEALWLTHTPRKQAIETLLDTVLSST